MNYFKTGCKMSKYELFRIKEGKVFTENILSRTPEQAMQVSRVVEKIKVSSNKIELN